MKLILQRVIDGIVLVALASFGVTAIAALVPVHARDIAVHQSALQFQDRHGLPLGTLLTRDQEHTVSVPLDRVAPVFLEAIIAAEDQRFFRHGALDARALVRALLESARSGRARSGASTISMQLARMLAGRSGAPTFTAKIAEIWLAQRLEAGMSKSQILAAYVNRLPMGGNIYGVEAAARIYFGVPAANLDLAQAAALAALPNDPVGLNPYYALSKLKHRRDYVLDRMLATGAISPGSARRAASETLGLLPRGGGIIAAPQFLFFAAARSPNAAGVIRTTLDLPLQQFAQAQLGAVLEPLRAHNVHHGGVLVVDNASGDVLAYVGSPAYFSDQPAARNDGVQALRQPGSTLKPFLYELALEQHAIASTSMLDDMPASYAIPGGKLYAPVDYDGGYMGPVRTRIALANSLNVPAVRVLEHVGVQAFLDRLHALGFSHLNRTAEYYGLGLTLGSGEVSLWELARAYVTLARGGAAVPLRVRAADAPPTASEVADIGPAELVTDMLADGHARAKAFGVGSVLDVPFPAAVKTGTSSDFRDTWTVGFTRDYTVAVWVGNFDGAAMHGIAGIAGAAPLWNRIMLHLHESREAGRFDLPYDYTRRAICAATGRKPTAACATIVQEYIANGELVGFDRANAAQFSATPREVQITFPHDGDRFAYDAADADAQALKFEARAPLGAHVRWRVNGVPLVTRGNVPLWRLRAGVWNLEAIASTGTDHVRITVRPGYPHHVKPGFSIARHY